MHKNNAKQQYASRQKLKEMSWREKQSIREITTTCGLKRTFEVLWKKGRNDVPVRTWTMRQTHHICRKYSEHIPTAFTALNLDCSFFDVPSDMLDALTGFHLLDIVGALASRS